MKKIEIELTERMIKQIEFLSKAIHFPPEHIAYKFIEEGLRDYEQNEVWFKKECEEIDKQLKIEE